MKKLFIWLSGFILLVPAVTLAADFRAQESGTTTLSSGETVKNEYLAGNSVSVLGTVKEDLVAAGNTVTISGPVGSSLMAAGNTVSVDGSIGHSARVAGANVNVNNSVGSDLLLAGGTINLTKQASVADDLFAVGGTVSLDGTVNGRAYLSGGNITINGTIKGDVVVRDSGTVTVGPNAVISGNFNYEAQNEASIASGAVISGQTNFKKIDTRETGIGNNFKKAVTAFTFWMMLANFILLIVLIYLLPRLMRALVDGALTKPWENIGLGLVYLIVAPVVAIIAFATLIGIPIGGLLLGLYLLTIGFAKVLSPLMVGVLAFKWLSREKTVRIDWLTALVGVVLATIISYIPVVGWIAMFLVFLLVLSQFVRGAGALVRAQR